MNISTYDKLVESLERGLSVDSENNGHVYYIDLDCMDRVCSCGAVYGRGTWWKKKCPRAQE